MLPVVVVVAAAHLIAVHAPLAAEPASSSNAALTLLYYLIAVVGGGAGLIAGFIKFVWPMMRSIRNFLSGWEGEPARPGVEARPGVMERLQVIEFDVKAIKHEVHLNSGQSIKDTVVRTEGKIDDLHRRVDAIDSQRETERAGRDDGREDIHVEDAVS
jgi:hypothetical protein